MNRYRIKSYIFAPSLTLKLVEYPLLFRLIRVKWPKQDFVPGQVCLTFLWPLMFFLPIPMPPPQMNKEKPLHVKSKFVLPFKAKKGMSTI